MVQRLPSVQETLDPILTPSKPNKKPKQNNYNVKWSSYQNRISVLGNWNQKTSQSLISQRKPNLKTKVCSIQLTASCVRAECALLRLQCDISPAQCYSGCYVPATFTYTCWTQCTTYKEPWGEGHLPQKILDLKVLEVSLGSHRLTQVTITTAQDCRPFHARLSQTY